MNKANDKSGAFTLIIDRFEGEKAYLIGDGANAQLDKKLLPRQAKEGDAIVLTASLDRLERLAREKTAKEILNEILTVKKKT